jgi:iron complex transport system permease protein
MAYYIMHSGQAQKIMMDKNPEPRTQNPEPRTRRAWLLPALAALLILTACGTTLVGPASIDMASLWHAVTHPTESGQGVGFIFWQLRVPRVLLSALVGAALATAGACLQAVFKNPMADPYILGVSAGGALGAAAAMAFGVTLPFATTNTVPLFALCGSLATIYAVYQLGKSGGRTQTTTMLLSGIALSYLLSGVMYFIITAYGSSELRDRVYRWMLGTLSPGDWGSVYQMLPYTLLGILIVWIYARELNALLLGEEQAHYLGVDVERTKKILLFASSLTCAGAVSVSGIIGFVGLIAPHVVRLIIGPDHRRLVPTAALLGAEFLLICDTLARTVKPPTELPVGIFTAFLGVPFFLYLLRKARRVYL